MSISRRLALSVIAGAAAAPLAWPAPAEAAAGPTLEVLRRGFSLRLPEDDLRTLARAAALPVRGFLVSFRGGESDRVSGRYFADDGSPVGGEFEVIPGAIDGTDVFGTFTQPIVFADGSSITFFPGTVKGREGVRVFASPLSADGRRGAPIPVSGRADEPVSVVAAKFGADAAIVAWQSKAFSVNDDIELRWRVVGSDLKPLGSMRTLARPDGIAQQRPLALVGLTGGGAALGYFRSPDLLDIGDLYVQRLDAEGEAEGEPAKLAKQQSALGLAAMTRNRFVASWEGEGGSFNMQIFGSEGRAKRPFVVDSGLTGLTGLTGVIVVATGLPKAADKGLAVLVSGSKGRRRIVSLLLIDETGLPVAAPARVLRTQDGPLTGPAASLNELIVLESGDLLAVYSVGGSFLEPKTPVGAIVRIN